MTKTEYEILRVLWEAEKPLTRGEIIEFSGTLKPNSASVMISRLLKLEYIEVAGYVQAGKAIARSYSPAITSEKYAAAELALHSGKPLNIVGLVSALSGKVDIDEETIHGLEEIIERLKQESKEE
ncbi:BlaI/MecI/CopY family transcriptional regulator [Oscillospiraceae bacterium OttesenSCG-928-F05]|nr:BlaI/MecI/CopY family transcriptional regulator [Oscillospiraceae bacterium OttesenSCG-928-F05]